MGEILFAIWMGLRIDNKTVTKENSADKRVVRKIANAAVHSLPVTKRPVSASSKNPVSLTYIFHF